MEKLKKIEIKIDSDVDHDLKLLSKFNSICNLYYDIINNYNIAVEQLENARKITDESIGTARMFILKNIPYEYYENLVQMIENKSNKNIRQIKINADIQRPDRISYIQILIDTLINEFTKFT